MSTVGKSTKAIRRAALREAAARREVARRRRNLALSVLAAAAVLGIIVAVFMAAKTGKPARNAAGSAPSASQSAAEAANPGQDAPSPAGSAGTASFPPLPPGADPALATKPSVKAGSGALTALKVTPLIEGKGQPVKAGQQVTANYVGVTYGDGKEFDSSWTRSEPIVFQVGAGKVIKGWDQGLVGVPVGSRVQLDIPPDLAYGDTGEVSGPLRFVVDVLSAQ